MKGFIYIIKNTINNKVYIGQTRVGVLSRWKDHVRHSGYGEQVINRAMEKYGKENFYVETLEECDIDRLDEREMYYIAKYDSTNKSKGYNVSIGGSTPRQHFPNIDVEKVINMYVEQLVPMHIISEKLKISRYYICTVLKQHNVKIRDRHVSACKVSKTDKSIIEKVLRRAGSLRSAAKELGMSYTTFRQACVYHNIEYNSSKSVRH